MNVLELTEWLSDKDSHAEVMWGFHVPGLDAIAATPMNSDALFYDGDGPSPRVEIVIPEKVFSA